MARSRVVTSEAKRASHSHTVSCVKVKPRVRKHLRYVAQTQRVAQAPQDKEQRDVGRHVLVIEGRASPLVEDAPTSATTARAVAECGAPGLLHGHGRGTVRTKTGTSFTHESVPLRY